MRTLVARRRCDASARDAWQALRGVFWWTGERDMAAKDAADLGQPIAEVVGQPLSLVYEGLDLESRITALEIDRYMAVDVRWRGLLRAEFRYQVMEVPEGCELEHSRSYRGPATRLLASVWRPREEEDADTLLRDWCWVAGSNAAQRRYAS